MIGMKVHQFNSWGGTPTVSFDWSFPPESAILTFDVSGIYEYSDWYINISEASPAFVTMTTSDGGTIDLLNDFGIVTSFGANKLIGVSGIALAANAFASFIVTKFTWPDGS